MNSANAESGLSRFTSEWVTGIMVLLALLPRVLHLGVFTAPDEQLIWRASNEFAMAVARGDLAGIGTLYDYPGVTLMWIETLAAVLKYVWNGLATSHAVSWPTILGLETPFDMLAEKRLVLGLVHVGLILLMWRWLDRLFGRPVAMLAILLIALDPFLLAESRVMRMEALNTELISLSVIALLAYLSDGRRRWLLISGIFAGLAILTKMSSLFLVFFAASVLVIYSGLRGYRKQIERPFLKIISIYAQWSFAALITVVVLWPAFWAQPIQTLRSLWTYALPFVEEGVDGSGVFFWGRIYPDNPGPWFYPVTLAFRAGPLVLPGIVLLLALLWGARDTLRSRDSTWPDDTWFKLGILAAFVASYVAFMSLIALKYDRYLLPVFPALNVMVALGIWGAWRAVARIAGLSPRAARVVSAILIGLIVVVQLLVAVRSHPYYFTYFNPLLGGGRTAVHYVRVGYTEGYDVVGRYLAALPESENLSVASAKSRDLQAYFDGHTIPLDNLDGRWVQADYVFLYISQLQRGKHDAELVSYLARREPEFVVRLAGVEYGKLYPGPAAQYYSGSKLEGRGSLYGYSLSATELTAGEALTTTVYFRNEGQLPSDRFYVRLVDAEDYVWAEDVVRPRPGFEDAFRNRKAVVEGEAALPLPAGMPLGQYVLKMGYEDAPTGQHIGEFVLPADADDVEVMLPRLFPYLGSIQPAVPLDLVLKDELSLSGYEFDRDRLMPGEAMWVTLYWQALADVSHDYVIGLQLLDEAGSEVTYWLGRPVRSSYPTDQWQARQVIQDPWRLVMPADLLPGRYSLALSVYDAPTARLVATTPLQEVWLTSDAD